MDTGRHKIRKLQSKLFSYYLLIPCLVLICYAIFFYSYVSSILLEKEQNSLKALNVSFEDQVEASLKDLDFVSANINYSMRKNDIPAAGDSLDISKQDLNALAELFMTVNGTDVKADQINLYDMNGSVARVGMITKVDRIDPAAEIWFSSAIGQGGSKYIGTPYQTSRYSTGSGKPQWFLSVYRSANRLYGQDSGVVETAKRCKILFSSIASYGKVRGNTASTYIFNSDGSLIYPYDITDAQKKEISQYSSVLSGSGTGKGLRDPLTGAKVRCVSDTSAYSGWTYLTIQNESVILQPVNRLVTVLLLITAALLLVSILLSYSLSGSMVKPVKHLKHIVQRMGVENLGEEKTDNYNPSYEELGELYEEFQKMSISLKTSMNDLIDSRQQELKSRSLALQSQANPHFYYNTLSCIIVLAENGRNEEVIRLCRTLSQIMRYITDSSSAPVQLRQETDYVQKYLYCMKIRYQDSLNYTIDIPEAMLDIRVPKLLVQPLVENAIKYGTDCIPPWTISVIGKTAEDGGWQIEVTDSGNGFSESSIAMLKERMQEVDSNPGMPELKIDGLGMINVYLRWKLYARDNAIFEFGNTPEGHAFVRVGCRHAMEEQ